MSDKALSDAQLQANRENARKSTGPRTIEGKARSRANSFKHGLTGSTALLPSDDRDGYEVFVEGIVDSLHPGSPLEYQICRDVASSHWRLSRMRSVESKMLTLPAVIPAPSKPAKGFDPFGSPFREPFEPLHPDMFAVESSEPPRRDREDDLKVAARLCIDSPGSIANISLYEQRIQRGIKNSMEELRRLRDEREALTRREMQAAIDRYRERKMRNLPLDLAADGFVFSIEEVRDAMRVQIRENEARLAKNSGFNLEKFKKDNPPIAA